MPAKKTTRRPARAKKAAKPAQEGAAKAPRKAARRKGATPTGPALVIVESPAKARTIGRFLGGDFEVRASMGHVRDLPVKGLGVEIDERGFTPRYEIIPDKQKVVKELTQLARRAPVVYFATDLDREGEAIAWHLSNALDVPEERQARVTFHEITKRAIEEAFRQPGTLNHHRVDAQQARRILDRIVGYPLSRLLSRSVSRGLSAGRVQSVAVRLVVEREKEIRAFVAVDYFRVFADLAPRGAGGLPDEERRFATDLVEVEGAAAAAGAEDAVVPEGTEEELAEQGDGAPQDGAAADEAGADGRPRAPRRTRELRLRTQGEADALVAELREPGTRWVVQSVEARRRAEHAPPPFITSTLQQQGSIRLRWTTKRTMKVAQELYEGLALGSEGPVGLITYMRTDSVSLAPEAVKDARAFIGERYGPDFVPERPNAYRSGKGAQEAHEAIRPTDVRRTPESVRGALSPEQFQLYKLVWERFVACQMAPAQVDTTVVRVRAGRATFEARGRVLAFAGFRAVAGAVRKKEDEPELPVLEQGADLALRDLRHELRTTQPPPRYTEATLVKRLEKEGIGRPSTYAETISKIQARRYVLKEQSKFHATELGEVVTDRMVPWFPGVMDVAFTRKMEEDLDAVEEGRADWQALLKDFYGEFQRELDAAGEALVQQKFQPAEGVPPCDLCGKPLVVRFSQGRKFYGCSGYPECKFTRAGEGDAKRPAAIPTEHVCEKCGKPMVIRQGRRGPFLACTGYPGCRNAKNVREDGTIVEEERTGETCEKCGAEMVVKRGRRGPFLACSGYPNCRNARDVGTPAPAPAEGGEAAAAAAAPDAAPLPTGPLPPCPKCEAPMSVRRSARGAFLGCTRYPECRGTAPVPKGALPPREPPKEAGIDCPECGKPMLVRRGRRGPFAGCSGYPKCRNTMPLEELPQSKS